MKGRGSAGATTLLLFGTCPEASKSRQPDGVGGFPIRAREHSEYGRISQRTRRLTSDCFGEIRELLGGVTLNQDVSVVQSVEINLDDICIGVVDPHDTEIMGRD